MPSAGPFPSSFAIRAIPGLSREVQEKLERVRPATIGQAARIPGVTPAAVAILDVYLSHAVFPDALRLCWPESVALSAAQVSALERHYELLVRWNAVLNLTAIRDLTEAVERHYCESLFLAAHFPPGSLRIADLGSGRAFPDSSSRLHGRNAKSL